MELRTLRYFLEIAREENMTRAAERLHVSQSALSRQVKSLEEELGKRLFIRHSFRIELTPEGQLLRKRAEDILQMVDKTTEEFQTLTDDLRGDIFIGCAESEAMKRLADVLVQLNRQHPGIHYHLKSGNTADIAGDLDKGLLDFAVIANPVDLSKYNFITLPTRDRWGAILPKDHPLAAKTSVSAEDVADEPLILSIQGMSDDYPNLFGDLQERLNVVSTFNLPAPSSCALAWASCSASTISSTPAKIPISASVPSRRASKAKATSSGKNIRSSTPSPRRCSIC